MTVAGTNGDDRGMEGKRMKQVPRKKKQSRFERAAVIQDMPSAGEFSPGDIAGRMKGHRRATGGDDKKGKMASRFKKAMPY